MRGDAAYWRRRCQEAEARIVALRSDVRHAEDKGPYLTSRIEGYQAALLAKAEETQALNAELLRLRRSIAAFKSSAFSPRRRSASA